MPAPTNNGAASVAPCISKPANEGARVQVLQPLASQASGRLFKRQVHCSEEIWRQNADACWSKLAAGVFNLRSSG